MPRQFAVTVAAATPAAVSAAQRALSLMTEPPNAAIELALFSVDDGARNAFAYVPRRARLLNGLYFAPNFGVTELLASV